MYKIIFIIIVILLSGCKKKKEEAQQSQAYPVLMNVVQTANVPVFKDGFGTLIPPVSINLTAQINGQIINIPVKDGAQVKQGDVIAQIDPRVYEANLEAARANLMKDRASLLFAEQTLEAYSKLIQKDFVSKINIFQYEQNVNLAKAAIAADIANIKLAELNMEYTRITAPIDGAIGMLAVQQGNWVNAGSQNATITNIVQLNPLYVLYALPETDLDSVRQFQKEKPLKVTASFLDPSQSPIDGEVFAINNTVDPTTGTILLKAVFSNNNLTAWPGQFVRLKTELYTLENAMILPKNALQTGQSGSFVYVVLPNATVQMRTIETDGYFGDDWVVVKSGLAVGENVVVDGQVNLYEGAAVQPQQELPEDLKHESI